MQPLPISKARRFRELLDRQTLVLPGAFNALTAMQIERAGFPALYVSGAGLSAARGLPDIGLLSLTEVLSDAATIANAVTIPAIVDVDTGIDPPLVVIKAVKEFERAGLAGMQIEDQELPKKCGHLPGKRLVSTSDMVNKICAASDARRDHDFFIIARTDARAVEGLDAAVRRARAYIDAGADAIIIETQTSLEELRLGLIAAREAGAPCVIGSMAYDVTRDGSTFRTMMGVDPERAAAFMEEHGAHIVALNCGTGMDMVRARDAVVRYREATALIDELMKEYERRDTMREWR